MSNQPPEEPIEANPYEDVYQKYGPEFWFNKVQHDISKMPGDKKEYLNDGYHSFRELYEHRMTLFQALCNEICSRQNGFRVPDNRNVWKSKFHSDGTMYDNMFIAGIGTIKGQTLTYHIHISYWDDFWVPEIDKAPEWDGHTPEDVLKLLKKI